MKRIPKVMTMQKVKEKAAPSLNLLRAHLYVGGAHI